MAEELIYNIEFLGTEKSIAAIQSLDDGISGLTKEVSALQQKQKEGQALTEAETKQLIEQKAQLKALQSDRQQQERQLINLNKSLQSNTGSYNELTTAVNAAKSRLKELPIDQTSEEFRKLQSFVANGTDKLKAFDKQIGDNQRNVGNYQQAIEDAAGRLSLFGYNLGDLKKGFEAAKNGITIVKSGFGSFDQVLKASALGVVILLLSGLIAIMTKFQPVVDKVEQVMAGLNAAVKASVTGLINLGNGFTKILSGNFKEGINEMRGAFTGLGASIKDAYLNGIEFAKTQQQIEDVTRGNIIANSQLNKEIDQLLLKAKNRSLSDKERIELLDQASAKEKEAFQNTKTLAELQLKAATDKYNEAVRTKQLNDEIEDARAEAIANINNLESESINVQEKINNRRSALLDEIESKRQIAFEAEQKRVEAEKAQAAKINEDFLKGAEFKQKEFEDQRTNDAIQAAAQVENNNKKKAEEKSFYDLAKKLRVDDTALYFDYLEGGYTTFKEFEDKKKADQKAADDAEIAHQNDIKEAKQIAKDATLQILGDIGSFSSQLYQNELQELDEKAAKEAAAIEASSLSEDEKAKRQSALQKKTAKEKHEIEVKSFKTNQALQAVQATIAGALAIVQSLAQLGPIAGAVAAVAIGITTALEVATILSAKPPSPPAFADGGLVEGAGSGTSDSIPALLSNGESVMTARATSMFAPLLSNLNVLGGGKAFANGGIVSPSSYSQLSESNQQGRAFEVINNRIDRMRVYQVESEVSNSQLRVGTLESEATW